MASSFYGVWHSSLGNVTSLNQGFRVLAFDKQAFKFLCFSFIVVSLLAIVPVGCVRL
jgi:hypothetical protein